MFIITAILSTRLFLPLEELHNVFFQPLIKIKVLVIMAFINKKPVYTKFLKGYNIIFFRLVIEFIKFLPDRFL